MTSNSFDQFMNEIGQVPLLTAAEEIELGRKVQRRERLLDAFPGVEGSDAVAATAMASEGLSRRELRGILRNGKKAMDRMITANLRLCVAIAKKHTWDAGCLELADLVQEASIGLKRAVERFDPERGYKLSTLSYYHIKNSVTKTISQKSTTIRIPVHTRDYIAQIRKLQASASANGKELTVAQAAEALDIKPRLIEQALRTRTHSLNCTLGPDTDSELEDLVSFDAGDPNTLDKDEILFIRETVDLLPKEQATIINISFFREAKDKKPLDTEIGNTLGISRSRVARLRHKALSTLGRHLLPLKEAL
jgi:RNA polymerase nonessential primary-like sigma factor